MANETAHGFALGATVYPLADQDVRHVIAQNGAVNYLENTATTIVDSGITFTVNDDKTVTESGTASADITFIIHRYTRYESELEQQTQSLKLVGCPSGGSAEGFSLVAQVNVREPSSVHYTVPDVRDGANLDIVSSDHLRYVYISIKSGTVISTPIVFKPMITLASQPNSDYNHYVEYAMTNRELTENCIKYKDVRYSNLSNSDSTKYYLTLTNSLRADLGANKVLSATICDFTGFTNYADSVLPNVVLSVEDVACMCFKKGSEFSGVGIDVRYAYI